MTLTLDFEIGAHTDFSKVWKEYAWDEFWHKLIKKDRESLDLVIGVVEGLVKSVEETKFFSCPSEWVVEEGHVRKIEIAHHFLGYLSKKTKERGIGDEESNTRYGLNLSNNLLRYLKRAREDKWLVNLLAQEDRENGEQFLYFMNSPPEYLHLF